MGDPIPFTSASTIRGGARLRITQHKNTSLNKNQNHSFDQVDNSFVGTVQSPVDIKPASGTAPENLSHSENNHSVTDNELFLQNHVNIRHFTRTKDERQQAVQRPRSRRQLTLNDTYSDFSSRLATFPVTWNDTVAVPREDLAKYGWVYTGRGDSVYCFDCKVETGGWSHNHTALGQHRLLNANCPFLKSCMRDILTSAPNTVQSKSQRLAVDVVRSACESALQLGYKRAIVLVTARRLHESGKKVNSDSLLEELFQTVGLPTADDFTEEPEPLCDDALLSLSGSDETPGDGDSYETDAVENNTSVETNDSLPSPIPEDSTALNKGVVEMRRRLTCDICLDSARGVLFLPCRHLISCEKCAAEVKKCPFCRTWIRATIKAFLDPPQPQASNED